MPLTIVKNTFFVRQATSPATIPARIWGFANEICKALLRVKI